jgi:ABC-2 type transport system permease protein
MLYRLWTLVLKELQSLWRDPQGRRILIVPLLLQLLIFPLAVTLEVKDSTLAIYNQDSGAASVELIQRLSRAQAFPQVLMVYGDPAMRAAIDQQQAMLAVRFPADFSRRLESGMPAQLQVIIDGRRSNSAQVAYGYVQSIVAEYAAERQLPYGRHQSAPLMVKNLYNPNLDYRWFVLPSLVAIITTIGALVVTALSLAREREEGTFEQLLVSPLTPGWIMVGKAIPGLIVSAVQAGVITAAAVFCYHVPFTGSLCLLYLSIFCYGLSLVGFGLMISSLCSTQQQAFLGMFSFVVPAVVLSGFMAPVENMPPVLLWLSQIDPLQHFIVIVKGVFLKDFGFAAIWPSLWPLLLIAVFTSAVAYGLFRQRVCP